MRLQARLALTVALAAALAILTMATVFSVVSAREQRQAFDDQLVAAVSEPRQLTQGAGGRATIPRRVGLADFFESNTSLDGVLTLVRITGPNGEVLLDEGLPEVAIESVDEPTLSTIEVSGQRFRMAVGRVGQNEESVLQIARSIEANEAGLAGSRGQILLASLIGVALAAILGALAARRLSEPIISVSDAAKRMAEGQQLPQPIDVTRKDEVGELAMSFNAMLSALEVSREQQKRLVADASHELRTPLTSLRLKLDLLNSSPELDVKTRAELISVSAGEVEQLGDLVTELVTLATDHTISDEPSEEAALRSIVDSVAEQHSRRSGRTIEIVLASANAEYPQLIRPKMVARAVSNLLDNAVKYSADDTPIEVTVDSTRVEVRDRGEGFDTGDLEFVFDRFYRSPTARTRPGSGIGLAIVHQVADVHGGTVWARNADDGDGAVVGFSVAAS